MKRVAVAIALAVLALFVANSANRFRQDWSMFGLGEALHRWPK